MMMAKKWALSLFLFLFHGAYLSAQQSFAKVDSLIGLAQYQMALEKLQLNALEGEGGYLRQAQIATALGNSPLALASYKHILDLDSNHVKALNASARLESQRANYRQASIHYYRLHEMDTANPYYLKQLGALSLKRGSIALAFAYFNSAFSLSPNDLELITNLSKLYLEMKFYDQCDSLLRKGMTLDSGSASLIMLDIQSSYRQKDYARMDNALNRLLRVQKDSSGFFLRNKGIAAYHQNDYQSSIDCLELLVKQEGPSELVLFYLGLAHRDLDQLEPASQYLNQSIEESISTQIGTYYLNLALVEEERGQLGKAIAAYQEAYQAKAKPVILYYLAVAYDQYYQDKSPAISYYQRYLKDAPDSDFSYIDYAQKRISELKKRQHFQAGGSPKPKGN